MTGTRAVITAVGVALVLGVAACSGDDPEPKLAPPSSSAPSSASTSPVAGGPTIPADAVELTQRGAARFVDFWFEALSYGMVTGDTAAVGEASASECKSCRALIEQIGDLYAKGGRVRTDGWVVEARRLNGQFDLAAPSFLLRVKESTRTLFDGEKVVDRTPMTKVPMHIELASESGSWMVTGLEILE